MKMSIKKIKRRKTRASKARFEDCIPVMIGEGAECAGKKRKLVPVEEFTFFAITSSFKTMQLYQKSKYIGSCL